MHIIMDNFDFGDLLLKFGAPYMYIVNDLKLVALLLLSYRCIVTINVLWLFLTVPWVGL